MIWAIVGVVVHFAVFGVYLASTAGRLDRLHHRVDTGTRRSTASCFAEVRLL